MRSKNKKISALAIVAHPDDETIWMGGIILRNKNFDWTIYSLCRKSDAEREQKFKKACEFYGARPIISDVEDEKVEKLSVEEIISEISRNLKKKKFDIVFTHNANGEYGHLRHKELHKAIVEMTKQNVLICGELYVFSYKLSDNFVPRTKMRIMVPKKSKMNLMLDEKEFEKKMEVIEKIYGFGKMSFEYLCCNKFESFDKVK